MSGEEDVGRRVVPIESAREAFRDSYPVRKRRTYDACRHRRFFVDPERGTVECRSCGEEVDPIRALERVCRWFGEYERTLEAIDDYRKRVGRLEGGGAGPYRESAPGGGAAPGGGGRFRLDLAVTRSTGRLHAVTAVREEEDGAPVLACGQSARVGIVAEDLRRDVVLGALRYGYGCLRCLRAVDLEVDP